MHFRNYSGLGGYKNVFFVPRKKPNKNIDKTVCLGFFLFFRQSVFFFHLKYQLFEKYLKKKSADREFKNINARRHIVKLAVFIFASKSSLYEDWVLLEARHRIFDILRPFDGDCKSWYPLIPVSFYPGCLGIRLITLKNTIHR